MRNEQVRRGGSAWALPGLVGLALVLMPAVHSANGDVLSDRMVISLPGAAPLFDNSIPEPAAGAAETTLTFAGGPGNVVPPPVPLAAVIVVPGVSVVVLTEPTTVPPEPGEIPIVIPGPNGPVTVSDVVISTLGIPAVAPSFISLVSDGGPDLAQIATILPFLQGIHFLDETGQLQDLTSLLVPVPNPFGPITVQVQSDAVPEPASLALLALGGLVVLRRR